MSPALHSGGVMAIFGTITLWGFAALGILAFIGLVMGAMDWVAEKRKVPVGEAPKPPAQIVNLRNIPRADEPDLDRPQILQKTTMQITTTKYVGPAKVELTDGK